MPGNFKKEDLRVQKTRKALQDALHELVEQHSFSKLSVYDLCERALVSRSAFYVHYQDKYDLLDRLLRTKLREVMEKGNGYGPRERAEWLSRMICMKQQYLRNLLDDADQEQLRIMFEALEILQSYPGAPGANEGADAVSRAVFLTFISGGIFNLLRTFSIHGAAVEDAIEADLRNAFDLVGHMCKWSALNVKGGSYVKPRHAQ